jgi:hypothetical protein
LSRHESLLARLLADRAVLVKDQGLPARGEGAPREALEEALAAALGLVTKADIRGWFKHCGYSLARE